MTRINAKGSLFASEPSERELHRLSKAALIDIVIDCCKRMYGEDVYADEMNACLNDACQAILRERGDKNPWAYSPGTAVVGAAFDDRPHERPKWKQP